MTYEMMGLEPIERLSSVAKIFRARSGSGIEPPAQSDGETSYPIDQMFRSGRLAVIQVCQDCFRSKFHVFSACPPRPWTKMMSPVGTSARYIRISWDTVEGSWID